MKNYVRSYLFLIGIFSKIAHIWGSILLESISDCHNEMLFYAYQTWSKKYTDSKLF